MVIKYQVPQVLKIIVCSTQTSTASSKSLSFFLFCLIYTTSMNEECILNVLYLVIIKEP